jgi:hypothetical protein
MAFSSTLIILVQYLGVLPRDLRFALVKGIEVHPAPVRKKLAPA